MSKNPESVELLVKDVPAPPKDDIVYLRKMLSDILVLAIPGLINFVFSCVGSILTIHILGSLDPKYTGASGIGSTISAFLAGSPLLAFASGLDTLIPQSFGKQDYQMCGIYLNRGIVFLTILGAPLYLLILFASPILQLLNFDKEMADLSATYAVYLIPFYVLCVTYSLMNSFMCGQLVVVPMMIIGCASSLLQPLLAQLLVKNINAGYLGAAASYGLTAAFTLGATALYIYKSPRLEKTVAPWTNEVFKGWGTFFAICGHSGLMSCVGAWAYHVMSILAGQLDRESLAAHVALLNLSAWLYMFPVGLGNAATILVGNKLGERNVEEAKLYAKVCVIANQGLTVIIEIATLIFRKPISQFYSTDPQVQELIASVIPVAVCSNFLDVIQGIFGRLIYAIGRQKYASIVLLVSHWAVRMPIACLAIFVFDFGLHGLWTAYVFSFVFCASGFAYVALREDWNSIADEIFERMEKDKKAIGKA